MRSHRLEQHLVMVSNRHIHHLDPSLRLLQEKGEGTVRMVKRQALLWQKNVGGHS